MIHTDTRHTMNIVCTQCHSSFSVPDGLIPPEGRKVRCANPECRAIFTAVPPEAPQQPEMPDPLFAGAQASKAASAPEPSDPLFAGDEVLPAATEPAETPPAIAAAQPPSSAPPTLGTGFEDTGEFRRTPFAPEEEEALAQADAAARKEEELAHSHRDLLLHEEMFPQHHRFDPNSDLSFDFVLPRSPSEEAEAEAVPELQAEVTDEPAIPEPPSELPPPAATSDAAEPPLEDERLDLLLEEATVQNGQDTAAWEIENRAEPLEALEEEHHESRGGIWKWASLLMVLLTVGGLGWMFRAPLGEIPMVRDTMTSLGFAPTATVEGIRVVGSDGNGIPQGQLIHSDRLGDLYVIRGKIVNDDAQPQPLPWLDVTLTDTQGQTVQHLQVLPENWNEVAPEAMQMVHYTRWLDHATHPRNPWPALAGGKSGDFVVFFRAIDNTLASVSRYAIALIPAPVQ